ncbi:MAG: hypothetical protein K0S35_977 [Geminicoccaceae bacterium]|jgi:hypothetical protein|nr:hypothetical protein [Geminicoccaceae bacterium]
MTGLSLNLPAPRHIGRSVASEDVARLIERSRILIGAAIDSLIEAEFAAPELGEVIDRLDRLHEKLRDLVESFDQPELPLA